MDTLQGCIAAYSLIPVPSTRTETGQKTGAFAWPPRAAPIQSQPTGAPRRHRMTTPFASILCFLAASLFGAVGQFLYKSGTDAAQGGLLSYVLNLRIALG